MKQEPMGALIAARRKALGMTQQELAERLGVTDKAVSKWERQLSCPDIQTLPRLAQALEVSLEELMQGQTAKRGSVRETVSLVLRAVCAAMGVAVTVLSAIRKLEASAALPMLGLGLACAGLSLLEQR